jgi:hypothetical protein
VTHAVSHGVGAEAPPWQSLTAGHVVVDQSTERMGGSDNRRAPEGRAQRRRALRSSRSAAVGVRSIRSSR